jgi:rhodanese-related sulfurtransferase
VQKLSLLLFFLFSFQTACAKDVSDLPENKQTPQGLYLTASEAYDLKSKNPDQVYFIDVRTQAEVEFLGMPSNADTNIPYMTNDLDEWDGDNGRFKKVPNSNFAVAVEEKIEEAGLDKDSEIILMCRSGTRSAKAAALLNQLGYSKAYTVVDGYEGDKAKEGPHKGQRIVNGWKNSDLPWTYKLTEDKMYFE